MAELLLAGADDYLTKPFTIIQLLARIKNALRFKDAQDRSDPAESAPPGHQPRTRQGSEHAGGQPGAHTRNSLVMALSKLVEYRDSETGQHLIRLQRYCRALAEEAARLPLFAEQINPDFIDMLVSCVPLHDIGKAMVPDPHSAQAGQAGQQPSEDHHAAAHRGRTRCVGRHHAAAGLVGGFLADGGGHRQLPPRAAHDGTALSRSSWSAATFRWQPASWPSPTFTMPCARGASINRPCRTPPPSRCSPKHPPASSTRLSSRS